jgi:hypothetical protein
VTATPSSDGLAAAGSVLAHGLGGRTDLPPDPLMAAIGAAVVVAASFLIVGVAWPRHRLGGGTGGLRLPRLTRVVDAPAFVGTLRVLVLAATLLVMAVAFLGPRESRFNLAPYALYVVFWVGLAFTSVLFGPVWARLNPLRTVHVGACRLAGLDPDEGLRELPRRVGVWPAAGALLVFVWLELVFPDRAEPEVVGLFLVAYAVVTVLLAQVYGSRWFEAGDGFVVYSRVLASLSPLGRGEDGVLVVRNPLRGLAALPPVPGMTAVVVVVLGSTGFDGLTRTSFWQGSVRQDSVPLGTAGLLALVAAVAALFLLAMRLGARIASRTAASSPPAAAMPGLFVHSLVPIALGYTVAHYFSYFLFEGQVALALVSDPFGQGWDLFGTVDRSVDYLFVGTGLIARVQVYAIVLGHVCGVVAAHDRALALLPPGTARRSQYPLAVVMVAITLCGVLLLLSA